MMDIDELLSVVFDGLENVAHSLEGKVSSIPRVKRYAEADDKLDMLLGDLGDGLTALYDSAIQKSAPVARRSSEEWRKALRSAYRRAGSPYGEDEAGFQRWNAERGDAFRAGAVKTGNQMKSAVKSGARHAKAVTAGVLKRCRDGRVNHDEREDS